MDNQSSLRKVLDSVEKWLVAYPYDNNRLEMIKHRHAIIEAITEVQLKYFDRS